MNKNLDSFSIDELCWVKIRGYPWWPAVIIEIDNEPNQKSYKACFLGEKNYSIVTERNIKKFKENFESLTAEGKKNAKKSKKNEFSCSLKIADLIREKVNIKEEHENFVLKYPNKKDRMNSKIIEDYFTNEENKVNSNEKIEDKTLIGTKRKKSFNKKLNKRNELKENEIKITRNTINTIKKCTNSLCKNIDKILEKSKKLKDEFMEENEKGKLNLDNINNINTKIEFLEFIGEMTKILAVPMSLTKKIDNSIKK